MVKYAYLEEDLLLNVQRFEKSEEWRLTLKLIDEFKSGSLRILDVGCGNGIAAIYLSMLVHAVVAVDPDQSDTVGSGAVRKLKEFLYLV